MPEVLSEKIEKFENFSNSTEIHSTNSTNSRKSCNIMDANENEEQKTTEHDVICSSSSGGSSRSSSSRSRSSSNSMYGATFATKARQDHYNPSVRMLKIDKSTNGACGFHLTRSKWDPYPWVSAVDLETPAESSGLKAGDCVLEINGEDVLGLRISDIASLAKQTTDYVTLLLWNSGNDPSCDQQSLCCGPMPTSLRRLSIIVQNILSIIECPVCLDTISPPAMQCQNGHLLCVNCRIRAEKCPVCRDRYTPRRALIAEQIYTAITNAFNLCSNEDKLRLKLFGPNAKQPGSTAKLAELKDIKRKNCHSRTRSAVSSTAATTPTLMPRNKFLAKLMGKSYSMDNIASSCGSMSNNGHGLIATAATSTPTLGVMMTTKATTTMAATSTSCEATKTPIATAREMQSVTTKPTLYEKKKVRNHLALNGFRTGPTTNMTYKQLSLSTNNLSQDCAQIDIPYQSSAMQCSVDDFNPSECLGKSLSPIFSVKRRPSSSLNDSLECLSTAKLNINSSSLSPSATSLITATSSESSSGAFSCSATSNASHIKNELLLFSSEEATVSTTAAAASTESPLLPSISLSVVLSTPPSTATPMPFEVPDLPVDALSNPSIVALENTQTQAYNLQLESVDCSVNSFSMRKLKQENHFRCPCNCGKIFNASSKLQRHVKVDHQMPILSFGASSAKLALPLQQPLDNAVLVLQITEDAADVDDDDDETVKNDDKRCIRECWIRLRATKENDFNGCNRYILLTALLQGSANEYSDFMLKIQVSGHQHEAEEVKNLRKSNALKKNEENDVKRNDNVSDGNAFEVKLIQQQQQQQRQQEQMTRSIDVNSMEAVATWKNDFDSVNQHNDNKQNNNNNAIINNKKNELIPCLSGNIESNSKDDFIVTRTICPTSPVAISADSVRNGGQGVKSDVKGGGGEILLNINTRHINKTGR